MKNTFAAIVVAVTSTVLASQAFAVAGNWTSPRGDFGVSLPEGWQRDPTPPGNPDALIVVSARPAIPMRTCGVSAHVESVPPSASQVQANAVIAREDAQQMMDGFPENQRQLIAFSNELLNGIQVASGVFEYTQPVSGERIRSYGRTFAIVRDGEFRYYSLNCGLTLPADEVDFSTAESVMSSLAFTQER